MIDQPIHTVLLVDDNPDDCEMVKEAWSEVQIGEDLRFVYDGIELLDYLYRRGAFMSRENSPRPSVILLDLNMPLMTGSEALVEIKNDSSLKSIPIVVLTTSKAPKDISQIAGLRVNGYIHKPNSYTGYLQMLVNLRQNWDEIITRPLSGGSDNWCGQVAWC